MLKISIDKRGTISIKLPISTLKMAFTHAPFMGGISEEDGTTVAHRLFDEAFETAMESGADGLSWPADRAALEQGQ